jgi:mandelate racemase
MNPLLDEPLRIIDGMAVPSSRPGIGLTWNQAMVRKYAQEV